MEKWSNHIVTFGFLWRKKGMKKKVYKTMFLVIAISLALSSSLREPIKVI